MKVINKNPKRPQNALKEIPATKVQEITMSLMELNALGKCKTDEEVSERIEQFFQMCADRKIRPGVETLSCALSISRKTLFAWSQGIGCSETRQEIILQAKTMINSFLEQCFLSGQVNPVSGIFLLKNWAGYRDTQTIESTTVIEDYPKHIDRNKIAEQLGVSLEGEDNENDF